jgi:hypothetical protein
VAGDGVGLVAIGAAGATTATAGPAASAGPGWDGEFQLAAYFATCSSKMRSLILPSIAQNMSSAAHAIGQLAAKAASVISTGLLSGASTLSMAAIAL